MTFHSAATLCNVMTKAHDITNQTVGLVISVSLGINCRSRLLYLVPEFLSSATWPLLPKKHFHGLIKHNNSSCYRIESQDCYVMELYKGCRVLHCKLQLSISMYWVESDKDIPYQCYQSGMQQEP